MRNIVTLIQEILLVLPKNDSVKDFRETLQKIVLLSLQSKPEEENIRLGELEALIKQTINPEALLSEWQSKVLSIYLNKENE